jgi:hypothetical protein
MPHPKVKIADNDGNTVAVTSNALDVNIAGGASIDIGDVEVKGHAAIGQGRNTNISDTTPETIGASTACKHVDLQAYPTNTGAIYVGADDVTATEGIALYAGDIYSIDIENVNIIYVLAEVDGEDVRYTYYV